MSHQRYQRPTHRHNVCYTRGMSGINSRLKPDMHYP